jgi:hypothetical protein
MKTHLCFDVCMSDVAVAAWREDRLCCDHRTGVKIDPSWHDETRDSGIGGARHEGVLILYLRLGTLLLSCVTVGTGVLGVALAALARMRAGMCFRQREI